MIEDGTTSPQDDAQVSDLESIAKRHLLMHFTCHSALEHGYLPIMDHGDGCWLWDTEGKRYFDGLSALFCVNVGYGHGAEIGAAVSEQMQRLPFYTNWSAAHPTAIKLAAKIADLAPGDLNRVFFVSSGSEANEAAMKLARQHFALMGQPNRRKMIARRMAYHGTTWGALSLNGLTDIRTEFEPLMPGVLHISNTGRFHRPADESEEQFTNFLLKELEDLLEFEDPSTVACIFLEPVQNAAGNLTPPAGYFAGVREICDRHGILVVADEVACGFGRLGEWFGSIRYDIKPDIIAFAKGVTSAHQPLAGVIVSDRVAEPIVSGGNVLQHGATYGGHPACCAAGLANIEIMEREDVIGNVRRNEPYLRGRLEELYANPYVGDVRGAGYFMAVELVKDKATRTSFTADERRALLLGKLTPSLVEAGLLCRAADYGEPIICISPPLIAGRDDIDWLVDTLKGVLDGLSGEIASM